MTNILPFQRKQKPDPSEPQKPPPKSWKPQTRWKIRSRWQRRWTFWKIRNLVLAALIGGLVIQYATNHGSPNSNSFQLLSANTLTSKVVSTFELCGQENRTNCVVDGDTIWYGGVKIRLTGIDAPELHDYKCVSELALGERSKRRLLELMNAGPFEVVHSGNRDEDKYGRKLRDIRRGGKSLGEMLIAEGLASPWEGQHHSWC